ncbi:alpha/beta hydrolase [Rhizorhapis sp.]|uniref:alpha/beta fold hydrolase n=1 Tax=Rhizorhapis sp. TaxID=1968842 RepID=UPI002B47CE5E|nr:alpha/beta hydrolase [Rhizorhapis sp.]HKR17248.1 alpha/beta hydrolase [Rhizorhapis sp.]
MAEISRLSRPGGLRLAVRHRKGRGPTIVFLPGYMSDMEGGKALALDSWAAEKGRAMLRLDYSGCGASEGAFTDGTLTTWRDDVLFLIDRLVEGPFALVGSSMGGWLALLVGLARPERLTGLVGIAAAPDFTDWGFTEEQKLQILREGKIEEPSDYGDQPYVTTKAFWQSGEANRLLHGSIAIDCPVRLLHGQRDEVVPWRNALTLAQQLRSADVQTLLIKDGDHRLSREQDLARLIDAVATLPEPI